MPDILEQPGRPAAGQLAPHFHEPSELRLREAAVAVSVERVETGRRYTLELDHPDLDPQQFHMLLRTVAPAGGATAADIVADWGLPDVVRPTEQQQQTAARHTRLAGAWEQFVNGPSRPAFIAVMRDNLPPQFDKKTGTISHFPLYRRNVVGKASEVKIGDVIARALYFRPDGRFLLEPLSERAGIEDPRAFILDGLKTAMNDRRGPLRQLHREARVVAAFMSAPSALRHELLARIPSPASAGEDRPFLEVATEALFDSLTGDDGELYYAPRAHLVGDLREQAAQAEAVHSHSYEARVFTVQHRTRAEAPPRPVRILMPGSVKRTTETARIRPHISWLRHNDGEREFALDAAADSTDEVYADRVLGALTLAYFAPEAREHWPTAMTLGRRTRKQELQEAQVPVLVLLPGIQKSVLNSQFVAAAEQLAA